jgi:hypothetical protein
MNKVRRGDKKGKGMRSKEEKIRGGRREEERRREKERRREDKKPRDWGKRNENRGKREVETERQ